MYTYERTYVLRKEYDAGPYSIKVFMDDMGDELGNFYTSLLAIIVTFVVGMGITSRFSGTNGVFVVLAPLWFFSLFDWINMFIVLIISVVAFGLWLGEKR